MTTRVEKGAKIFLFIAKKMKEQFFIFTPISYSLTTYYYYFFHMYGVNLSRA